jgi:hypothetical protein
MSESPIYSSPSTAKSLWQEYHVFQDRVELKTHLGTLTIPLEAIESVEVRESDLKGLMRGELNLKDFRPALKLDWANFVEHVVIDKSDGRVHRILFTPENPAQFKEILDRILSQQ